MGRAAKPDPAEPPRSGGPDYADVDQEKPLAANELSAPWWSGDGEGFGELVEPDVAMPLRDDQDAEPGGRHRVLDRLRKPA